MSLCFYIHLPLFLQTTNEKINSSRYSYLQDEEGNFHNRFDRGVWHNILEFLQVPGYFVDYSEVFTSPDTVPPAGKNKEDKVSWYARWFGRRKKDQHDPVPTSDAEAGLGGLSDIYAHTNSQELSTNFQSAEGLNAGTLEMRRRKDKDSSATSEPPRDYMV